MVLEDTSRWSGSVWKVPDELGPTVYIEGGRAPLGNRVKHTSTGYEPTTRGPLRPLQEDSRSGVAQGSQRQEQFSITFFYAAWFIRI